MGTVPSTFKGDSLPVEHVSYNDISEGGSGFLARLKAKGGLEFKLPTEAQWEYVCRAGDERNSCPDLDGMAWYGGNAGKAPQKVGSKKPNAWGIYDIYGNVSEWCGDWYVRSLGSEEATDPQGPSRGQDGKRSVRGMNWQDSAKTAYPSRRNGQRPENADAYTGLRLLCMPPK